MPTYKIGEVAELLGVSTDKVRRWADEASLNVKGAGSKRRKKGEHRKIDGAKLAAFLLHQQARELEEQEKGKEIYSLSARNRFQGLVTRVIKDKVAAQVEIQSGRNRIVALTTREAVEELGLEAGVLAVASIKSTNVVVERPEI